MAEAKQYEPFIFLSTRVVGAASDMIEEIGFLQGVRHSSDERAFKPHQISDLRGAIAKVHRAIENYDAAIGSGVEKLTSDEFEAAAITKAGA